MPVARPVRRIDCFDSLLVVIYVRLVIVCCCVEWSEVQIRETIERALLLKKNRNSILSIKFHGNG
jgi:hypothetical protein